MSLKLFHQMNMSKMSVDYQSISARFSVQKIEEIQQGVKHLNEQGYAVFSDILNNDQINHSIELFWQFLEGLKAPFSIQRDDPTTWNQHWPGSPEVGIINDHGIGQSEFLWYIRANPNVKKIFSSIWNSNELCVSFDGAGCYRNWHRNAQWKTQSGWYHCDQNPFRKPARCSIQGLIALTDNTPATGGLVLVPYSHQNFIALQTLVDEDHVRTDFVLIPSELMETLHPRFIQCKAGDLIVWDSRTIHCNTPAFINQDDKNVLLRLVAYVCMSPLSMFIPDGIRYENLEEYRQIREDYVQDRTTCTHWPLELFTTARIPRANISPLTLTAYQHSLIIGTNVESQCE